MRLLFLFLFLSVASQAFCKSLDVTVSANSAILINAETGAVLYEKKADDRAYPASLTKIATCLYSIKKHKKNLNEVVACPQHCLRRMSKSVKVAREYKDPAYLLEPDGSHYMIKKGEKLQFLELLYGLMVSSGNDAANYLAYYLGGSIPKFVEGMNEYLTEIGCENTHFSNPHGLHHPKHYSTARDIACIAREALQVDLIRSIVSTKEHQRLETNLQTAKRVQNKNLLIQPGKFFYPQAIGMKTGYHSEAGYTYAGVAKDRGRTVIAILLGCAASYNQCFRDAIRLFDAAFAEEKEERLLFNKEENIFSREIKQARGSLKATLTEDVAISYYPAEEPEITIELNWDYRVAPIEKGSFVGCINILDKQGNLVSTSPLVATENVDRAFTALLVDAMRGDWVCPDKVQQILIFFLSMAVGLSLFGLFRIETVKKRRKVHKR
ncbi:MAG: D-alanyl-D-alanine carboxypeptidase family protein [Simkaniaceae bacterium]|nr:D-alanyl-D-alanine carboxypeptidase family protein [Simkaniaceae bacterium]